MRTSLLVLASIVLASCVAQDQLVTEAQTVEQDDVPSTAEAQFEALTTRRDVLREQQAGAEGALSAQGPTAAQIETFGPLTEFVGKTFKGAPLAAGSEAKADIQQWNWALGGSAILIKHAIEDGSYGGNTYVYKDAASGDLVYVYITNAGFRTEGSMTVNDDGTYIAEEAVEGHPSITKVRSTSRLADDGSTLMTSEYLDDGVWTPGHRFLYKPTSDPLPPLAPPVSDE
ncbi:MAG: hypothetical protein AAF768_11650 [Pseudomonadota bacterium]